MSEAVVKAMRSGAGLPVLQVLDRYLFAKAGGDAPTGLPQDTLGDVLAQVDAWLDTTQRDIMLLLGGAHRGALADTIARYARRQVDARKAALARIAPGGADDAAWARLEAEFTRLQTLRLELQDAHAAAAHLREVAALLVDVPRAGPGSDALDAVAAADADGAARPTPAEWLRAARAIETICTDAVRPLARPTAPAPGPTPPAAPVPAAAPPAAPVSAPHAPFMGPAPAPPAPAPAAHRNGHHANGTGPALLALAPPTPLRSILKPVVRAQAPVPAVPMRSGPAGPDVLAGWSARVVELALERGLRHGPFWAPIAAHAVTVPGGDELGLMALAKANEIDLVDVELPRLLAVAAGGTPAELRARIAERARDITLREPRRRAREAFLDYLHGKLPLRYRADARGLALVESVAIAITADEAWEASDADYGTILRRMVAAELSRTPAVDVAALARGLVGGHPDALQRVKDAAAELAAEDDAITLTPDGILVRADAPIEDPDALYALKAALSHTLGEARAQELINALVTAGSGTR